MNFDKFTAFLNLVNVRPLCTYLINGKSAYFVKLTSLTAVNVSFQYFADMLPTYCRYA